MERRHVDGVEIPGLGFVPLLLHLDDAAQEVENLFKEWEGRIAVRGVYSTVGFRADSDLMLWLVGLSPDEVQQALVEFGRTNELFTSPNDKRTEDYITGRFG